MSSTPELSDNAIDTIDDSTAIQYYKARIIETMAQMKEKLDTRTFERTIKKTNEDMITEDFSKYSKEEIIKEREKASEVIDKCEKSIKDLKKFLKDFKKSLELLNETPKFGNKEIVELNDLKETYRLSKEALKAIS